MTTRIPAFTVAPDAPVRFSLLPGDRFDGIGVPSLIGGVEFADSNDIITDFDGPASGSSFSGTRAARCRDVQVAPPDQELLLQTQGIQMNCHACLQDRSQLEAMIYLAAAFINSR